MIQNARVVSVLMKIDAIAHPIRLKMSAFATRPTNYSPASKARFAVRLSKSAVEPMIPR